MTDPTPGRPEHPTRRLLLRDADVDEILAELQEQAPDPQALRRWAAGRGVRTALVRAGAHGMSVRLVGRTPGGAWVELASVDGTWRRTR
ncbi:hypothetical protein OVA14_06560 [Agrococcus sp. SL85]|uniref:hypothetical protein n=1 Tax=Agrococcus sp. SL85 TaxID=2995141 RepID=UPI00226CA0F4|nr:hypothetical protein [Agrococcus sp. SL85]WAC67381.1 hypothetical protein OVA14_06560 [Agrococcus sp. SL85]